MRNALRALLWTRREWPQLILGGLGFSVGLFVLLATLRFGGAIRGVLYPAVAAETRFVVINKKVVLGHTLGLGSLAFSPEEIADLKKQSFVRDLGPILTTNFAVSGSAPFAMGQGYQSELFFEAVADRFLGHVPDDWGWGPGQIRIPAIISREFLALYNFGFAVAQGLPQLTEETIGLLPFQLVCSGGEDPVPFSGRIVGFTDRYSTILVPMEFMVWANATIGRAAAPPPSRVVIEVDSSERQALRDYLGDRSYETNDEKLGSATLVRSLRVALSLMVAFGGMLVLVSLCVLVLTSQLLVGRAQGELRLLHHLGFTDGFLSLNYMKVIMPAIAMAFLLAGLGVLALGPLVADLLGRAGFTVSSWPTLGMYISFLAALLGVSCLFYLLILRMIRRIG